MARPVGTRNADYETTRAALLDRVTQRLMQDDGARASFRELAAAAGVTPATLRHYFETREGVVAAAFDRLKTAGLPHLLATATGRGGPVRESLTWFTKSLLEGWKLGVGRVHALGLSAGLNDAQLGPAYVNDILEPTLQAMEARLAQHLATGELGPLDLRHAAIEFVSPLVLVLLHQDRLGGVQCRPLNIEKFVEDHIDRFLRAHAPAQVPTNRGEGLKLVR